MTTTLVCLSCNQNNSWTNNQYQEGHVFKCASCSARLQQVFCPHCSKSNMWSDQQKTVESQKLCCGSCSKHFQFVICPHCELRNMWPAANYEEGLKYDCYSCKKSFQSITCPHCYGYNMFATGVSFDGTRIKCQSCEKTHQYIRCPHCQKGQIWKNNDYKPGSVVPCWSCKQSFAHMCCPHCETSNFWKEVLNTTISFVCYACKKDMSAASNNSSALSRVKSGLKLARTPKSVHATNRLTKHADCDYFIECKEYIKSLSWPRNYFDMKHDRCYCESCYSRQLSNTLRVANADYVIPRHWAGFGLGVDPFRGEDIWNDWIAVYHGTTAIAAQSILHHRQFLLPGDTLVDGTKLPIRPGHIPGKIHVYTSPSIQYASLEVYSTPRRFVSPRTSKRYLAQIVFQCKQKPGTFETQSETVGWGSKPICKFIPNDRIEHFTDRRSTITPYRLLIRLKLE